MTETEKTKLLLTIGIFILGYIAGLMTGRGREDEE
jgi:hypothetical protein